MEVNYNVGESVEEENMDEVIVEEVVKALKETRKHRALEVCL